MLFWQLQQKFSKTVDIQPDQAYNNAREKPRLKLRWGEKLYPNLPVQRRNDKKAQVRR